MGMGMRKWMESEGKWGDVEEFAVKMDEKDPLAKFRAEFAIPKHQSSQQDVVYLCGEWQSHYIQQQ